MSEEIGKPSDVSQKPSYETHMGFAEWHMMLAEVERMPVQAARDLVSSREHERAELAKPISHLQNAVDHFKEAAIACAAKAPTSESNVGILERAEVEENCRRFRQISSSMERVLEMVRSGQMPTIEDMHYIESLLLQTHMAMEQNARIRAVAEEIQSGGVA
jgi:hypothetical protein